MAKKNLAVLIIAALTASGVFAQGFGLSAGLGGYVGGDFGGGSEIDGEKGDTPYFGGGGFAFFDATYAELSAGVLVGGGKWSSAYTVSIMNLNISVLGKYPIAIGEKLSVFPLLGIDYQAALSLKDEDGEDATDKTEEFSALWFKLGGGLDYAITGNLYLRFEALYGIRLENEAEKNAKKDYGDVLDVKTLLGHGLTAKIAVGFKF
jgi:opacity protein-like surface antigen